MSCYYITTTKVMKMQTDWFHDQTEAKLRGLVRYGGSLSEINAHINKFFDAHVINPINAVCVTINCQRPWPDVLLPLWGAAGEDEDEAALFLGGLYCRVAIMRQERWMTANIPIYKNREDPNKWATRHYVLWPGQVQQRRS